MGSPDARAYSRNKRGIAGSLIWINFDRHALLNLIQQCAGTFVADIDEIRPQYSQVTAGGQVFQSSVVRSSGPSIGSTINNLDALTITSAGQQKQIASPWYSDQVLPFDITLAGANEYGAMCNAKIFGVEILNEGFGISIDDAVTEMHMKPGLRLGNPLSATIRIRYGSCQLCPSKLHLIFRLCMPRLWPKWCPLQSAGRRAFRATKTAPPGPLCAANVSVVPDLCNGPGVVVKRGDTP